MSSVIRTPDQRLRVFVSSTLGELAPERAAVRGAVERLHLTPVMFELGARPHPPRELYRAYLEQSQVFVGIYWQSYGWIAPDETVSGLEDEYRLAGDRPRLLYVKRPASDREGRLADLIVDFQADDRATYKAFTTPEELAKLVEDDLALLLSERFEAAAARDRAGGEAPTGPPRPLTETIGRDRDVDVISSALRDGARLITLTGPGGVGKSRLAVEVARRVITDFPDGVHVLPLVTVTDADRALHAIADELGTRVEAGTPADAIVAHLRDRAVLLVLDNAEQIDDLGPAIVDVLERTAALQVVVTSRRALRVRGEKEYAVAPLPVPAAAPTGGSGDSVDLDQPAMRLFVDRARAADHRFVLAPGDAAAVAEIVRRLDGLPLAIELAAARIRLLSPSALLERLATSLDVLAAPGSDLPERQRTLRATVDWSYDLLINSEQALLARLSVFAGGWTLEAAETVFVERDLLDTLASLLDKSLVVADPGTGAGAPRFRMLATIGTYAGDRLAQRHERDEYRRRHLAWCRALGAEAQPYLCGPGQRDWVARMDPERANLRQAVDTALALDDHTAVVELAWDVVVLYFVRDAVDEPDSWLQRVADAGPALDVVTDAKLRSLLALTRIHHGDYDSVHEALLGSLAVFREHSMDFETAVALHQLGFVRFQLDHDVDAAVAALEESSTLFARIDHDWGVGLAQAMLGSVFTATGDLARAEACQQRALERAQVIDSDQQTVQALGQLALIRLLEERYDDARQLVAEAAPTLHDGRYRTDTANALDVLAVVAHKQGDDRTAATAVSVAAAERARLGIEPWPTIQRFIDRIRRWVRQSLGDAVFADLEREASQADTFATLDTTLATTKPT